ncbi:MAG: HD domain-containing protein [Deltaproteobacteria bacterium]|jgi:putative hydrolase of HD superfamily|nr:HD domain-containing protein [Deltaproteobacteria bacterium]
MQNDRLRKQLEFIREIDKLKTVLRQSQLTSQSRKENDAEHSWHLAVMAILLSEYAKDRHLDIFHVVKLVLIHDLVEIDAGDTFCYDKIGNRQKLERETLAADRIFNILPQDQASQIRNLWDEFEARETPEACFAAALDRLQPLLQNFHTQGGTWQEHGIKRQQVIQRNSPMNDGAPALWEYAEKLIDEAVEKGILKE